MDTKDKLIPLGLTVAQLHLVRDALWLKYQGANDENVKREIGIVDTQIQRLLDIHD